MNNLKDIIAYIIKKYPIKDELSNARLTKMVFLSDWHQSITKKKQISNIEWFFDNYGPFVWEVYKEVKKNIDIFNVIETTNGYGQKKVLFQIKKESYKPKLSDDEKKSIDHVIEKTKKLNWDDFIKLVYSTYPIISSERYSKLNLIQKAKEYEEQ